MQFMLGICAEKALEQHLCERFHYSHNMHIFILTDQMTLQTQILRSRGFDVDMPDVFFMQMHFSGQPKLNPHVEWRYLRSLVLSNWKLYFRFDSILLIWWTTGGLSLVTRTAGGFAAGGAPWCSAGKGSFGTGRTKDRELLLYLFRAAFRTLYFLIPKDELLKVFTAIGAFIFINRHCKLL